MIEHIRHRLAHWWCEFNVFEWPSTFPLPKPKWWEDGWRPGSKRYRFITVANNAIAFLVGTKALLREWNADRMTEDEFETFWRNRDVLMRYIHPGLIGER